MSLLTLILTVASGIFNTISNLFTWKKHVVAKEEGKKEEELNILRKENEDLRKQMEILNQDRPKSEVEQKLDKGDF